ncbi:TetR/AcrR family transcriptional regulator C-terminal domain-containing protein [Clostridium sp. MT-14]|jgi:AcrR family transcriptional regulator|uniref:TetR family transcriptional regulator C-terminal domain-containing protein n=1 Tax=Clostridium aromativorans TaxID=2836848 RepID=A0ABS8N472_9CLOT|nr:MULTISPECIES: TetR-like C-terminal domain-containing protein [Clostridium]KAA8674976.1 TetR/AcrR family transcriptional regulator [Clostridium sp. HV4-5-A1G]MCC9294466.1 TetR family transcriptional regulator C-terminal domain-containing protein [Clostridium aromativorans]CAB1255141.1 HTH tetR-type domain-containing protein [Clostridiaceae bacterium BL-3]
MTSKTNQLLKDTFIELYTHKPINKISVKELCQKSSLNRGTFYNYYENIDNLLEEIEEGLLSDLVNIIKTENIIIHKQQDLDIFLETIRKIFNYIKQHSNYFKALLGKNGDNLFTYKIKSTMKKKLSIKFKAEKRNVGNLNEYLLEYISSANIGVITYWVETGMKTDPEELIGLMIKVLFKGPFNIR